MKEVKKIGYVNPESEHQSGLVIGRGGTAITVFGAMERPAKDNTQG